MSMSGYRVLNTHDVAGRTFALVKTWDMSYFSASGRARLKTQVSYSVQLLDAAGADAQCDANRYWFKSKALAMAYIRELKNSPRAYHVGSERRGEDAIEVFVWNCEYMIPILSVLNSYTLDQSRYLDQLMKRLSSAYSSMNY